MRIYGYLVAIMALLSLLVGGMSASKGKPHGHQGMLTPFDGTPLAYELTDEQIQMLDKGSPVMEKKRSGSSSGRGSVIQDIHAPPEVCMALIVDLEGYSKYVPFVRKVEVTNREMLPNGTVKFDAEFKLFAFGFSMRYFLKVKHEPEYNTVTWTLDYSHTSDFDDNVGHWQVMPHPTKPGWTRLLYSTELKLFSWIPEFIVRLFTGKGLINSTAWVKRESEKTAVQLLSQAPKNVLDIKGGAIPMADKTHSILRRFNWFSRSNIQSRSLGSYL